MIEKQTIYVDLSDMSKDEKEKALERIKNSFNLSDEDKGTALMINGFRDKCHDASKNWWINLETGQYEQRNVLECIALVMSELGEAVNFYRKGQNDDKLIHRPGIEVEMADAIIRIMDLCGGMNYDIGGAIVEKMAYNKVREDHKLENRMMEGGKKH